MAKPKNLAMMSLDALVKLRDDVTEMLGNQAVAIQEQLARLAELGPSGNTGRARGRSPKVPVKYRDKNGNTWSGRGAQPRWMTAAIKAGAKRDDFLVGETSKNSGKKAKKARPAKKAKLAKRPTKKAKPLRRAKRPIARPKVKASKPAKRASAQPRAKVQTAQRAKRAIPQPQPNADVSPVAVSSSS
jgi:DNA-binding protein H-NS